MDQNLVDNNQNQEQNPLYVPNINSSNSNANYYLAQNIPAPEEPYYSNQNTNNVQQYPIQVYPDQLLPTQNMDIPQNQSYNPPQGENPIQYGDPISYYPLEPGALNVQPNPLNQYNKSYNSIEHKGIIQTEPDTFYITTDYGKKNTSICLVFLGIINIVFSIFNIKNSFPSLILGLFLIICALISSGTSSKKSYIILYPNSIGIIKRSTCSKKNLVYNIEELERIDFIYEREDNKKNKYTLNVVRKNGNIDNILNFISYSKILFTSDEIEYFLYTVNNHIQAKMRA
jgi:hypothetical protein